MDNDERIRKQLINEYNRTGNPERIITYFLEENIKTNEKVKELETELKTRLTTLESAKSL